MASDEVRQLSARRRVFIVGDWSLLILHAAWNAKSGNLVASSIGADTDTITKVMSEIDGQALTRVLPTEADNATSFEFDLGGSITIWPSAEAADQWSLHEFEGSVAYQTHEGRIIVEAAADTLTT